MGNGGFLYTQNPHLYDAVHSSRNHGEQSTALVQELDSIGVVRGVDVLEAACGTGENLVHLSNEYRVAGFDKSSGMIEIARRKLSSGRFWVADLQDFSVSSPYGAILCLGSAISYLPSPRELLTACKSFAKALVPGGALIVAPWLTPSQAVDGALWFDAYNGAHTKISRQAVLRVRGRLSVLDYHWLVSTPHDGVRHHVDRHELYLFSEDEIASVLVESGFRARLRRVRGFPRRLWVAALEEAE